MSPKDNLRRKSKEFKKGYNNTIKAIKSLSERQRLYASLSLVLAFAIISALTGSANFKGVSSVSGQNGVIPAVKTIARLEDLGTVERHEVPGATKTVIYVPQIHKEPTSNPQDKTNDQAYVIQRDIYKTLNAIVGSNQATYVMDETDLYGPMPADKIAKIKQGFADIDALKKSMDLALDQYIKAGGSQQVADGLRQATAKRIDAYERNLYLTGGAAVLAAENPNAHVYGSQNKATIDEARTELQDIVYLEGRINQLQGAQSTSGQKSSGSGTQAQQMQKILSQMGGSSSGSSSSASLTPVYTLSQEKGDDTLKSLTDDFRAKFNKLSPSATFETSSASVPTSAPANPYAQRTDLNNLKAEYQQKYAKFMKLAKDQRSQEVSDNIVREMDENGQNSAILVFGEQHKDQLIDALNKKGVSVIVVTPPSEVTYLASQSTAAGTGTSSGSTLK